MYCISPEHTLSGVDFIASPNVGEAFSTGFPDTIILHYTATKDMKRAICMLCDPEREVSAHLVVDRDGGLSQLVPFNTIAWHAGKSSWNGRESLNRYSIGIEIVNAGKLVRKENGIYTWDDILVPNCEIEARISEQCILEYWHKYTFEQINAVKELCGVLKDKYVISNILAHSEISPGRKIDPGPLFPIEDLRRGLSSLLT